MASPIFGLPSVWAGRCLVPEVPTPGNRTSSPWARASPTIANTPSAASLPAPLLSPVRAAKRSAISVLFTCSPPALTLCRSTISGWYIARLLIPTTTNSRLPRRPATDRRQSSPRQSAGQCAPQQRLYFRPEPQGQGSLRPTLRPNAGGSSGWSPAERPAELPWACPPRRDFVQAFRLHTNSGIIPGASRSSSSSPSSVNSDRPR